MAVWLVRLLVVDLMGVAVTWHATQKLSGVMQCTLYILCSANGAVPDGTWRNCQSSKRKSVPGQK